MYNRENCCNCKDDVCRDVYKTIRLITVDSDDSTVYTLPLTVKMPICIHEVLYGDGDYSAKLWNEYYKVLEHIVFGTIMSDDSYSLFRHNKWEIDLCSYIKEDENDSES